MPRTLAKILRHRGLFAPPPQTFERGMSMPSDFATSNESRMANATPSRTACTMSERLVSIVIPVKVPRALVSLMGLRSPMRYGRK